MKNYISLSAISAMMIIMISCGEPDYPTPTPSITTLSSKLTVVHAIPGGERLKIKIDNRISDKDTVRFEKAPNGKLYNTLTLTVPAGANRLINVAKLDNTNLVTDRYSPTAATNNTSFIVLRDDKPAVSRVADDLTLPDVGFAKIRFFNLSPNTADVKLTNEGGTTNIFTPRKYNTFSAGSTSFAVFTSVPAATYNYEVRLVSDNALLFSIPSLKLDSKGIYTVYVKGLSGGIGDSALTYAVIKH